LNRYHLFLVVSIILWSILPGWAQSPEPFGLQGKDVTTLAVSPMYGIPGGIILVAGTDGQGVFRYSLSEPDSGWIPLGLEGKGITALNIYHTGVGPLDYNTPFACVKPDSAGIESALMYHYIYEGEWAWVPSDSGLNGIRSITAMTSISSSGHEPPGPLFASAKNKVFRSMNMGLFWEELNLPEKRRINTLQVRQMDRTVWLGGGDISEIQIFPWIAVSDNQGDTWHAQDLSEIGSDMVLSIALPSVDLDMVYASLFHSVIKTTDSGDNWENTSLLGHSTKSPIRGLAVDSGDSQHIWMVGNSPSNTFVLYESSNGGETWNTVEMTDIDNVSVMGISSLVSDPIHGGVVFIGTRGNGVWRYDSRYRKGDVDGNGLVNVNDVLMIVNIIAGHRAPEAVQLRAADMNDDGRIDVLDIVQLIRNILGYPYFLN